MKSLRLLLWAVIAVSLGNGAASIVGAAGAPRPAVGTLMPAAGGPIEELAIQFHRPAAHDFLHVFGGLIRSLDPETTTVRVVVADDADVALFEAARAQWGDDLPTVTYARTGRPITSWMRDRLAVLEPPQGGAVLLVPAAPQTAPEARVHDWTVPWTLGEHLGRNVKVRDAPFRFDGGDLIGDTSRVYVADPLLQRNPDVAPDAVLAAVQRDVGREVVHVGAGGLVPDHHIGMFLTPLPGDRVLVGDPDLAAALLPDAVLDVGGQPLEVDHTDATRERFRQVSLELRAAGLEVIPLPLVPSTARWAWLSYGNVLMEHRADGRLHVVVPVYGVPVLDRAALAIWEREGAVVHAVDVAGIFRYGGSVRCLTAPIVRRTLPPAT